MCLENDFHFPSLGTEIFFTGTNTFEHAEFKSEKFALRRPAVFSQTAILSSLISRQNVFIVQRHGLMMTNDYVTQKDQFLLTSLPFNKNRFARIILSYKETSRSYIIIMFVFVMF